MKSSLFIVLYTVAMAAMIGPFAAPTTFFTTIGVNGSVILSCIGFIIICGFGSNAVRKEVHETINDREAAAADDEMNPYE